MPNLYILFVTNLYSL